MGITKFSISLLQKYTTGLKTVIELGAQNLYDKDYDGPNPYADEYYLNNGFAIYKSIDLSGENGSLKADLSKELIVRVQSDLVTDFGTSEHIGTDGKFSMEAIYNCWLTKHDLVKMGGIMINENPKTGNWPGHGFNYYTQEFYKNLCAAMNYEILEIGEHPAMGNVIDGWNVYCVLRKTQGTKFISLEEFSQLGIKTK